MQISNCGTVDFEKKLPDTLIAILNDFKILIKVIYFCYKSRM